MKSTIYLFSKKITGRELFFNTGSKVNGIKEVSIINKTKFLVSLIAASCTPHPATSYTQRARKLAAILASALQYS